MNTTKDCNLRIIYITRYILNCLDSSEFFQLTADTDYVSLCIRKVDGLNIISQVDIEYRVIDLTNTIDFNDLNVPIDNAIGILRKSASAFTN